MLQYLLKNSELSGLFRFLSPNFIQVASPLELLGLAKQLKRNRDDAERWRAVRGYRNLPLHPTDALTRFFHQILSRDTWILDFRSEAFRARPDGSLDWDPKPYYHAISPKFLAGIRDLYSGFYLQDDARFDRALAALGLTAAGGAIRTHLGEGDPRATRFELRRFQATFAAVFDACARERIRLHPDFFLLGIALLGLYENLERDDRAYDVSASFEAARSQVGLA